jgi:RNA polymerase sigma-70 factor (ECF subfamily)
VPVPAFAAALETSLASAARGSPGRMTSPADVDRYLSALHLEDLALACACALGHEAAWEHFVLEFRPVLYRSADALAPGGSARDIADSIYGDLFGLKERDGERQSLFRYFHGRSSLATWLRAVLAQRHVDRIRSERRMDPIDEEGAGPAMLIAPSGPDPDKGRYFSLVEPALARALAQLSDRDRLRLGCYYGQDLTLADTGRLLGEHEATVSRQLARTRKSLRQAIEQLLRSEHGLNEAEVARCFESVAADPGTLDLRELLSSAGARKETEPERSS